MREKQRFLLQAGVVPLNQLNSFLDLRNGARTKASQQRLAKAVLDQNRVRILRELLVQVLREEQGSARSASRLSHLLKSRLVILHFADAARVAEIHPAWLDNFDCNVLAVDIMLPPLFTLTRFAMAL